MFEESLKDGEYGEHAIWNLLMMQDWTRSVVDVRKDKGFQEQDIDFLVENYHKQFASFEVKTDYQAHDTGNIVYELTTSGHEGCFEKTKAKYIMYFVPKSKTVYQIDVARLREHVRNGNFEVIQMGDNSTGHKLKIKDLVREGVIIYTYEGVV